MQHPDYSSGRFLGDVGEHILGDLGLLYKKEAGAY